LIPRPRRHLAIHSRHEHTIEEMHQLATPRALDALSCLHMRTPPLTTTDDSDYVTVHSWSEYGWALQSLSDRVNRRWLDEMIRVAARRI
jgi:hypothetical protein